MTINRPWTEAGEKEELEKCWRVIQQYRRSVGRIFVSKFLEYARILGFDVWRVFREISRRVVNFVSKRGRKGALLSMPLSRKTRQLIPVNYFLFTSASARVSLTQAGLECSREEREAVPSRFAGASFRLREF